MIWSDHLIRQLASSDLFRGLHQERLPNILLDLQAQYKVSEKGQTFRKKGKEAAWETSALRQAQSTQFWKKNSVQSFSSFYEEIYPLNTNARMHPQEMYSQNEKMKEQVSRKFSHGSFTEQEGKTRKSDRSTDIRFNAGLSLNAIPEKNTTINLKSSNCSTLSPYEEEQAAKLLHGRTEEEISSEYFYTAEVLYLLEGECTLHNFSYQKDKHIIAPQLFISQAGQHWNFSLQAENTCKFLCFPLAPLYTLKAENTFSLYEKQQMLKSMLYILAKQENSQYQSETVFSPGGIRDRFFRYIESKVNECKTSLQIEKPCMIKLPSLLNLAKEMATSRQYLYYLLRQGEEKKWWHYEKNKLQVFVAPSCFWQD